MPNSPRRSGIEEFRQVIADYKSIGPWLMGGAIFVPLADYVLQLGPPWPQGIAILTSVVELLVLINVFHFWFASGRKRVSRRLIISIVLLIISFSGYLYLSSSFIFSAPPANERFVKGFVLRSDVAPLLGPSYTVEDALIGSEYHADEVWTGGSITAVRLSLLSLWVLSFIFLSTAIASFVIYYHHKPAQNKAPTG